MTRQEQVLFCYRLCNSTVSRKQVAEKLGVSQTYLSKIYTGDQVPSEEMHKRLIATIEALEKQK